MNDYVRPIMKRYLTRIEDRLKKDGVMARLHIVRSDGGGAAQEWSLETTSPGVLTRAGWTRQSLKAGDKVSVVLSPLRDGSHGGSLNSVTLLDTGQKLVPSFGKEQPGLK